MAADPVRKETGGGDRWVNAEITIIVPLDVPVEADGLVKQEAVGDLMDLIDYSKLKGVVSSGRWEDVRSDPAGGTVPFAAVREETGGGRIEEGGTWICPGCGTGYVRDVGRCGQLEPWICEERVVSGTVERAARAIAVASDDCCCFEELDSARAGRVLSGEGNYADEVLSGADGRAYYCALADAALRAAPSVSQQGTGEREIVGARAEYFRICADRYRRCLELIAAGRSVRNLDGAKAGYDRAHEQLLRVLDGGDYA